MPRGYRGKVISGKEATRRWRERNPDKVKAANRKPRKRIYDPIAAKQRRLNRLQKPGYRELLNQTTNTRMTQLRRWLDNYKLERGCVDCGYRKHNAALHFDHVEGKKIMNVCNAKSIEQAKLEIAKCEVRCANCHAEKTFKLYDERVEE